MEVTVYGEKKYFYYTNNRRDDNIIVSFKLSYLQPCYDSRESSWISVFHEELVKNPTCKTRDRDGNVLNGKYFKVSDGISLKSLYNDNDINIENANDEIENSKVNLYARNFYDKNEECIEKYFSDFEDEEKTFQKLEIIIKILNIISMALILILVINSIKMKCNQTISLNWYLFIIHAYAIIAHVVSISLVFSKKKLKYNCDEDIGFNNKINDIFSSNVNNNSVLVLIMGIFSSIHLITNLIVSLCLKLNKKYAYNYAMENNMYPYPSGIENPIPMPMPMPMAGMPQPIIVQQNLVNNNSAYTTPYNNGDKIDNQMLKPPPNYFHPNKIKDMNNNNIPPPSATPLEKKPKKKKKKS